MENGTDPIERKIQLTGGSTYTVSLPKEWAKRQEIESGSKVHCYPREDRLIVARVGEGNVRRTVQIDGASSDPKELERAVASAYVSGCDAVRIEGVATGDARRTIRKAVEGLVGFEIDEENDDAVLARAMLETGDVPPGRVLMQIEMTTLSMHEDAIDAVLGLDDGTAADVKTMDATVDRLFALLARRFQRSLVDVGNGPGADDLTPFDYYTSARQLERIADHAVKIAGAVDRIETPIDESLAARIRTLGKRARDVVRDALSGFFEGDRTQLQSVVADAEAVLHDLEELDRELYELGPVDGYPFGIVLDSLVRTAEYGVNIAEAGLRAEMRQKSP
ncbi:MAG: phosphate uptake regulator PhoU [Haloferacaceae archaeon]